MENRESIGRSVAIVSHQIRRRIDKQDEQLGITHAQARLLVFIFSRYPERDIYQRDIEQEFDLRRSSATGLLQLMEKNGLICREAVESDGRLKRIVPLEKAFALREKIEQDIRSMEDNMRRGLTEEELRVFFAVMRKISGNLGESRKMQLEEEACTESC